ncbi:hypothetical protein [Kitasatospora sp. NPDC088134]|uniref:hypothetical protein n=1 Tax=Kitasatospora sp. NPDC088134 TaxID=3364071 RepID=UPI0038046D6F
MRAASTKRLPTAVQCGCYRLRARCWTLLVLLGALLGTAGTAAAADTSGASGTSDGSGASGAGVVEEWR